MGVAIIGAGHIGKYIALGSSELKGFSERRITLTRRKAELLDDMKRKVFPGAVGKTLVIEEEDMNATALVACGIAVFFRAIRAGIEIGFHSEEALTMAAQTAKGAASLLLPTEHHPEPEIDRVTTPRGCTIAGLNQMEHDGF